MIENEFLPEDNRIERFFTGHMTTPHMLPSAVLRSISNDYVLLRRKYQTLLRMCLFGLWWSSRLDSGRCSWSRDRGSLAIPMPIVSPPVFFRRNFFPSDTPPTHDCISNQHLFENFNIFIYYHSLCLMPVHDALGRHFSAFKLTAICRCC